MAIAIKQYRVNGVSGLNAKLIDNAVATGNGEWIDIRGLRNYSVTVSGITTATVVISGSNDDTKPAAADHGEALGSASTSDETSSFTAPFRWLKARVSVWSAGTIDVEIEGNFGS